MLSIVKCETIFHSPALELIKRRSGCRGCEEHKSILLPQILAGRRWIISHIYKQYTLLLVLNSNREGIKKKSESSFACAAQCNQIARGANFRSLDVIIHGSLHSANKTLLMAAAHPPDPETRFWHTSFSLPVALDAPTVTSFFFYVSALEWVFNI
jgi:hypothetical protein